MDRRRPQVSESATRHLVLQARVISSRAATDGPDAGLVGWDQVREGETKVGASVGQVGAAPAPRVNERDGMPFWIDIYTASCCYSLDMSSRRGEGGRGRKRAARTRADV
jgi:hypothetical protein